VKFSGSLIHCAKKDGKIYQADMRYVNNVNNEIWILFFRNTSLSTAETILSTENVPVTRH